MLFKRFFGVWIVLLVFFSSVLQAKTTCGCFYPIVSQIPVENPVSMKFYGDHIFVLQEKNLYVVDFKNPKNPQISGIINLESEGHALKVEDGTLIIVGKNTVFLFPVNSLLQNLTDYSVDSATRIDISEANWIKDVKKEKDKLFICYKNQDEKYILGVYKISSNGTYVEQEELVIPDVWENYAKSVILTGDYIYLVDSYGFKVYKVDLDNEKIEELSVGGTSGIYSVDISNLKAFIADKHSLYVEDLSKPQDLKTVAEFYIDRLSDDFVSSLKVVDNKLLFVKGKDFYVMDVSDLKNMKLIGIRRLPQPFVRIFDVKDNLVLVGNTVIDISNPQSITLVARLNQGESVRDVKVLNDNVAFVARGGGGVDAVGIKNLTGVGNIKILDLLDNYEDNFFANGLALKGSYVFVSARDDGVVILKWENSKLKKVGAIKNIGDVLNVFINKDYLFVCGNFGVRIYDITNPENPIFLSSIENLEAENVFSSQHYLYVAGRRKFLIYDVSEPKNPVIMGSLDMADAFDVVVYGNYAYVADRTYGGSKDGGFKVIDVSNPCSPKLVARISSIDPYFVSVSPDGKLAYTGWGQAFVVDVSNPEQPLVLGVLPLAYDVWRITDSGKFLFVSGGSKGVYVFNKEFCKPACRENFVVNVGSGWNLLSNPTLFDLNVDLFDKSVIVWKYLGNGTWAVWSPPDSTMASLLEDYLSKGEFEELKVLKPCEGFWVLSKNPFSVSLKSLSCRCAVPLNTGWYLLGSGEDISQDELSQVFPNVRIMWKFSQGKWYAWSSDNGVLNLINAYVDNGTIGLIRKLKRGEGFWIKVH